MMGLAPSRSGGAKTEDGLLYLMRLIGQVVARLARLSRETGLL